MIEDFEKLSKDDLLVLAKRQAEQIRILGEVNSQLKGHFVLESLLKAIMTYTKDILNSETCSLLLYNEDDDRLYFSVTDENGLNLSDFSVESSQGIVGAVFQSGESLIVNDAINDDRVYKGVDEVTGFETRSLLCVPMMIDAKKIGVVEVLNSHDGNFDQSDMDILISIASQSALAIQFVRANETRFANQRLAVVGNMAAGIVHDLRNSMQVIGGFSQLIALKDPEQSRYCDIIRKEIDKLVGMTQEVLEFSRGETIHISPFEIQLDKFVNEIYEFNRDSLKDRGIEFEFNSVPGVSVKIDESKMQRVIQNIVSNGIDAMDDCEQKKIQISCGIHEDSPFIKVTDFGKGMEEKTVQNIFKPFFTKGKENGTGLGMSIVQNIIEGHNAEIQVESTVGVGSTFTIIFPQHS
ncbi:MAG: GAF domain-containing sensor histidine kinase [Candidatus Cloacimonetes bacterium]|nr:GAF domain-containing sensor histidine kinase [Candidatus Cloacimonadota bacterium]